MMFNDRLARLFATVHPNGRGPYLLQEVAAAITAEGDVKMSASYLSQLRSGQKTNPSAAAVNALATFFHVDPKYFFDDDYASRMDRDLEMLVKLRDSGVRNIAARAADLSPTSRQTIESLIETLRKAEGLTEVSVDHSKDNGGDH